MAKQKYPSRDTLVGTRIEDSRYLRAICSQCDEPIRVTHQAFERAVDADLPEPLYCNRCRPSGRINASATRNDPSPSFENAVRVLEDR